jgi:hypothetical protein
MAAASLPSSPTTYLPQLRCSLHPVMKQELSLDSRRTQTGSHMFGDSEAGVEDGILLDYSRMAHGTRVDARVTWPGVLHHPIHREERVANWRQRWEDMPIWSSTKAVILTVGMIRDQRPVSHRASAARAP